MVGMRKVVIFKNKREKGKTGYQRVFDGHGLFHQFGVEYEECETGVGNYSTAIIEMPDGKVRTVPVEMIEFNN